MPPKELIAKMRFDGQTKRFHRFTVYQSQGLVQGSVYISKDINEIPSELRIRKEVVTDVDLKDEK